MYNESTSETSKIVSSASLRSEDGEIATWISDNVTLLDSTKLSQYEFATHRTEVNPFVPQGQLGLGRDSGFLKALIKDSRISSEAYSFFWGNEVTSSPREGSLTLGGYDEALLLSGDPQNITLPFAEDRECREGMVVSITSLRLRVSGGGTEDAWAGLKDLEVCILPDSPSIMTIPAEYWDPIEVMMGVKRHDFHNGTSETLFYNTTIIAKESA